MSEAPQENPPEEPTPEEGSEGVDRDLVPRMARYAAPLGLGATALFGYLGGGRAALSAFLGALFFALNFWALAHLVTKILVSSSGRGGAVALLMLKLGALFGVMGLLLHRGWVSPLPFTAGLSTVVLSMVLAGSTRPAPPEGPKGRDDHK